MKFWQVVSFSEPEQLVEIARAAEEAGFHGVLLADHVFFPGNLRSRYPYSEDGKPGFDGSTLFPDPPTVGVAGHPHTYLSLRGLWDLETPLETTIRSRTQPKAELQHVRSPARGTSSTRC
jgi:hypothetical protein